MALGSFVNLTFCQQAKERMGMFQLGPDLKSVANFIY